MTDKTSIGVRELKENPSRFLRRVQEDRVTYDITIRGEVVARLVPAPEPITQETIEEIIARHEALAKRIGEAFPEPFSVADLMDEERRDL